MEQNNNSNNLDTNKKYIHKEPENLKINYDYFRCKPNKIVLYFNFGIRLNKELHEYFYSKKYKEFLFPTYLNKNDLLNVLGEFTKETMSNQKLLIQLNSKAITFLVNNNFNFDLIYPTMLVKDLILNEYLDSLADCLKTDTKDYWNNDLITNVFGTEQENLKYCENYDVLSFLSHVCPNHGNNKIVFSHHEDTPLKAYKRYFNIK
jgi:hypothetical protein